MRTTFKELLESRDVLLADGATGTNFFVKGLGAGDPPEFWNVDHPGRVAALHQRFVYAGADIILTNTFGCNRHRLKLHNAQDRVFDLARRAAEIAAEVADAAPRPVLVGGSIGPTGELFEPLGAMTEAEAIDTFREQAEGLKAGGADVAWIETMSAVEEVHAAARGAIAAGMDYTVTCSFDTAGRTMMGLRPHDLPRLFDDLETKPLAIGANCGVGASDALVSLLAMSEESRSVLLISKGNCGVPQFHGTEAVYTGTPEQMAAYARLAADAGARIVGGCCGTSPEHLVAMREALDQRTAGARPSMDDIVANVGPLVNAAPGAATPAARERRRSRGSD